MNQSEIEIEQHQRAISGIEHSIEELKYTLNNFVAKRAFNNFIKRKIQNKEYDKHIGLISIIRKDLETLSELFYDEDSEQKKTNDSIAQSENKRTDLSQYFQDEQSLDRIILYIDDLDRCSDQKVLEVIQAVHLLMAFPLFNVVVGVDKRCVTNALIYKNLSQYNSFVSAKDLRANGIDLIAPDEYLEKIFQIPFTLEIPHQDDVKKMVRGIVKDQIETKTEVNRAREEQPSSDSAEKSEDKAVEEVAFEEGPIASGKEPKYDTEFEQSLAGEEETDSSESKRVVRPVSMSLSQEEAQLLEDFSLIVGRTPRTIKRFINLYRFMKAKNELKEGTNDYLVAMFLLAMQIGDYRKIAEEFFYKLESAQEDATIKDLLDLLKGAYKMDEAVIILKKLQEDKSGIKRILDLKIGDMKELGRFVKRFSFSMHLMKEH